MARGGLAAARILERAGITGDGVSLATALDEDSRALVRRARFDEQLVHLLLLKPDDVPTYVDYGTADLGVCGRDVLVEHPDLVAQRIVRFAKVVGRENIIAGADCGFATFAGSTEIHPSVVWAKFDALVEGARIATRELWGRA